MPSPQYALNPNYYSAALGQSSKRKRLLTGRGLTTDEALSGYYADIAARQAEMEAASVRKARTKQQELAEKGYGLDVSKFEEAKSQFGKELAYKYDALNKEYALGQEKANLLREQMENQMAAAKIQGALQSPLALERAIKGGKEIYGMAEKGYDWLAGKVAGSNEGGEINAFYNEPSNYLNYDWRTASPLEGDVSVGYLDPETGETASRWVSSFSPEEFNSFMGSQDFGAAQQADLTAKYYGGNPQDYMDWGRYSQQEGVFRSIPGGAIYDPDTGVLVSRGADTYEMKNPFTREWTPLTGNDSTGYSFELNPELMQTYKSLGMEGYGVDALGLPSGLEVGGMTTEAGEVLGSAEEAFAMSNAGAMSSEATALSNLGYSSYLAPFSAGALGGKLSTGVHEFGDVATFGHMFGGEKDAQRAGGFLAGALSGAAMGTVTIPIPVVGTVIGGILGGLGGLFGSWK